MTTKYEKLEEEYDELLKASRALVNHILRIKKRCETEKMWLMATRDPHLPLEPTSQQGPMVNKMFDLTAELKEKL